MAELERIRASLLAPWWNHSMRTEGAKAWHRACKTTAAVIAFDGRLPRIGAQEHPGHERLGDLHRFTRIDGIGDVDHPVGIDRIRERAEVVVARIGGVGVVAAFDHRRGQFVVGGEPFAVKQSLF